MRNRDTPPRIIVAQADGRRGKNLSASQQEMYDGTSIAAEMKLLMYGSALSCAEFRDRP